MSNDLPNKFLISVNEERALLANSEEFTQMATYKKYIASNKVEYSHNFLKLFDLTDDKTVSVENIITKIYDKIFKDDLKIFKTFFTQKKVNSIERLSCIEYRILHKNNRLIWVNHKVKIGKENTFVIGIIKNITKEKKLQVQRDKDAAELRIKNRDLEQFAYATTHDLKQPITTILDLSKQVLHSSHTMLSPTDITDLKTVINEAKILNEQLRSLFTLTKIGTLNGKELFDLNAIVKRIQIDLIDSNSIKNIQFNNTNLPSIYAFKREITLLFHHLIGNAIKFSYNNELIEIDITFKEDKQFWYFSIKDNGVGIPHNQKNNIFNLFTRLENKISYSGTGMGLSHCRKIVYLHNGTIKATDNTPIGTKFTFSIIKENHSIPKLK